MDSDVLAYKKWRLSQGGGGVGIATGEQFAAPQTQRANTNVTTKPSGLSGQIIQNLPSLFAAGLSFVPGVGTAGAAALGAGGEALRQKLSGEKLDLQRIGEEGALSAIPGGIGKVAKLVKSAKAAKVGVAAVEPAARAGGKPAQFIENIGKRQEGKARGITPGSTATGQEALGFEDAGKLNEFLSTAGVRGGSAATQLSKLEQIKKGWVSELDTALKQADRPLNSGDMAGLQADIQSSLAKLPNVKQKTGEFLELPGGQRLTTRLGRADSDKADTVIENITNAKTLTEFNNARKALDDRINFGRKSGSVDPETEQVYKDIRRSMSRFLGEQAPNTKALNQALSRSYDAEDFLKGAARNPKGAKLPFSGVTAVSGEAVQGIRSGVGQGAQGLASLMRQVAPLTNFGKAYAGQAAGRFGAQTLLPGQQGAEQAPISATAVPAATAADTGTDMPASGDLGDTSALSDGSVDISSPDTLQKLYQQALAAPDAKTQKELLGLVAQAVDIQNKLNPAGSSSAGGKVAATARKEANTAKSAMRSIQDIKGILSSDPGKPLAGALGNLAGSYGRRITGSAEYEAAVGNALDALIRLRTGAAATKQEMSALRPQLPQAGDTPDVQQYKIQRFEQLLQDAIDAGSGQTSDPLEILQASGY